jgi:mannose-6-phosphate isomerase
LEPLQQFISRDKLAKFNDQELKAVVRKMLLASVEDVKRVYSGLTSLPKSSFGEEGKHIQALCPRLAEQYDESDPGILVALITMNYLVLEAGESLYIPADGIHAYLGGEIIECMARSNNV